MTALPLHGLRVADFTWVGAGPLTTRILALYGADVIKIESRAKVDGLRLSPPFKDGVSGVDRSGYFADRNPNKRSITIDLRTGRGRELAQALVATSDVAANNFTPGTMERFGLGWEEMHRRHPGLIYLAMSMHGREGPFRDQLGYGQTISAMTALHHLCGYRERPSVGTGTNFPDHIPNPTHSALAVLAALRHRRRTGHGQLIDVAQSEPMISLLGVGFVEHFANGVDPLPGDNSHPHLVPHGVYPCANEEWMALSVGTDAEWERVCTELDIGLRDEWRSVAGRGGDRAALDERIAEETRSRSASQVVAALISQGIAAGVVRDAPQLITHPQLVDRCHWATPPHREMGASLYNEAPFRLSETPGGITQSAPLLGEHTDEVCRDVLGLNDAEIHDLRDQKILF